MSIETVEIVVHKDGHTYPTKYVYPTGNAAVDATWEILNSIPDGEIPDNIRFFLAGQIAGTIIKMTAKADTPHSQ